MCMYVYVPLSLSLCLLGLPVLTPSRAVVIVREIWRLFVILLDGSTRL
jgi:hypothetical protein